ncbi:MAG: alpha/beta hydrolase fold domain-containing protein [Rhizomicrobium sp.]
MAIAQRSEQWAPAGIHVLDAGGRDWLQPYRWLKYRLHCRLSQFIVDIVIRRGWAMREDRAALHAYVDKIRRAYLRGQQVSPMAMDEDAVRTSPPDNATHPSPIPSDWFEPRHSEPRGTVLYVHGGSFMVERSPRITALVARFAAAANARVYAPKYRLAPENPCPAAVEDIVAAYRWHRSISPDEPVVAIAESAGAAILLAALQKLRDDGDRLPCGILLLSPWVDLALQSWSMMAASLSGTSPYTMESFAVTAQLYLQGRNPTDPVASPIYGDFKDFPPILIHACQEDILFDDAVRLAEKVREANGNLTVRVWRDETHVWERAQGAKGRQSVNKAARFIRERLDASVH